MTVKLLRVLMVVVLAAELGLAAGASILLKPNGANAVPLRTKSVAADVTIGRQFATTDLTLVFQNETSERIEADFLYTLPPGAVVTYFAYWYGDEKVVARVVEKQRAAQIYQKITSRQRDPALIELVGKNLFRARIFPVMPDADLKVQMVYVQALPLGKDSITYTLPLSDADKGKNALDSIDVSVLVKSDKSVAGVTTNLGIPVTQEARGWRVSFSGTNYRPQKDLSVRLQAKGNRPLTSSLYAARSGGPDGFFALALTPDHSLTAPVVKVTGVRVYDIFPARITSVKANQTFYLYGRYRGSGAAEVTLSGKSPNGPLTYREPLQFGSASEPNNIASKLWAAKKIEQLSLKAANRRVILALCTRYTLPSKFASWLAIPKEERDLYQREMIEAKIDGIAVELGKLISAGKGDTRQARAMKTRLGILCKQVGRDPQDALRNATYEQAWKLGEQMARLVLAGKEHSAQARRLTSQLTSLCRQTEQKTSEVIAGAGVDIVASELGSLITSGRSSTPRAKALKLRLAAWCKQTRQDPKSVLFAQTDSQAWDLSEQIAKLIVADKESSPQAQRLKVQLSSLCKETGRDPSEQIDNSLSYEAWDLSNEIVDLIAADKQDTSQAQRLRAGLSSLCKRLGRDPEEQLRDSMTGKIFSLSRDVVDLTAKGQGDSAPARRLRAVIEDLCKRSGADPKERLSLAVDPGMQDLGREYVRIKYGPQPDEARAAELLDKMKLLAPLSEWNLDERIEYYRWRLVVEKRDLMVTRLYDRNGNPAKDPEQSAKLRKQITEYNMLARGQEYAQAYDAYLDTRLETAALRRDMNAAKTAGDKAKSAELARRVEKLEKHADAQWEDVVSRWGDPLISIEAPADAVQVVAIMPDGEVKRLEYNADANRWQGRFDIPLHAREGSYIITIVVVMKDGTRKVMKLSYRVDVTAPTGKPAARLGSAQDRVLRLELTADDDTARVTAVLPWNERVELKPASQPNTFFALVPIPDGQSEACAVTFILTDKAHNRTVLTLDVAK